MTEDGRKPEDPGTPTVAPIPQSNPNPRVEVRTPPEDKTRPGVMIQFQGFGGPAGEFAIIGTFLSYYEGDPAKEETIQTEDAKYRQVAQFTMERQAWIEFEQSLSGPVLGAKDGAIYSVPGILTIR